MSKERFQIILIALRFDDLSTREERKSTIVTAAMSEIFDEFISNCQKYYRLSENTTVDDIYILYYL